MPSTAVVEIIQEIERMAGLARENLVASMEALADKNLDKVKEINAREKIIDYLSSEITDYLVEVNRYELPLADSRRIGALFHVVIDLERIGDHAINILENAEKRSQLNEKFTGAGKEELTTMYTEVLQLFDKSMEMFVTNKKDNITVMDEKKDKGLQGNEKIEEAILALQQEPTEELLAHALTVVRRRMREQGQFIVAVEPPSADVKEAVTQDAGTAMRLQAVQTSDGKKWWSAFTGFEEELKGSGSVMSTFLTDIEQLFRMTLNADGIEGVILNPWNRTLMLDKQLIRIILGE